MFVFRHVFLVLLLCSATGCASIWGGGMPPSESSEMQGAPPKRPRNSITVRPIRKKGEKEDLPAPELVVTPEVRDQLLSYLGENRKFVVEALERLKDHRRPINAAFNRNGVPEELIAVGFVESGFKVNARSPAGARGMWQFMKGTAKAYGLTINILKDDRLDPKKSSDAASRHLRDLYLQFRDWNLALAAYNAGSATVTRALRNSKNQDFWSLIYSGGFKRETREFVPRVLAAAIILDDPSRFGFEGRN